MILIVGNVTKDVYLNLDSRTEDFETDASGATWLDLSFNSSDHHFFNRFSSLGGAAITLEVLTKFGISASISGSDHDAATPEIHRYILVGDNGVSYLSPSHDPASTFIPPHETIDYIYIDRSAHLSEGLVQNITEYLAAHESTKLILYAHNQPAELLAKISPQASLIFLENDANIAEESYAPASAVHISNSSLSCQNITEKIKIERIDRFTHLSAYSIASATILASFISGKSIEESLRLARLNVENSTIDSTLDPAELNELSSSTAITDLELIAAALVHHPKGILAADESGGSIEKKFAQLNIPDTFKNRHTYRNIFFTTPGLEDYINGVILFDETARDHMDTGEAISDFLISHRIIPGIKVDQGLANFPNSEDTFTKGLDGLPKRLHEYYQMGLRFAKWRAAFTITASDEAISENCRLLAEYAKACQSAGLVPIVEPELIYDGDYDLATASTISGKILDTLFETLSDFGINLRACILKCSMVLAGKRYHTQSTPEEVGAATAEVLKNHAPTDLAGVVFLSGGQSVEQATANLAAIIKHGPFPWPVTFSFARALQDPALFTWKDEDDNLDAAKKAFQERLIANTNALKD